MEKDLHQRPGGESGSTAVSSVDIRQLVADHYGQVYGYAFRLTGNRADAEDVTQQTFLIAHQKLHQVRQPDRVIAWLLAVVRSCYAKSRRRRRPTPAANLEMNVEEIPAEMADDPQVDRERLQSGINELADEFKMVLVMFYFQELSYKEIAAELDVPIGTVMSRLSRAKGRLRVALSQESSGDAGAEESALLFAASSREGRHPNRFRPAW